MEAVIRAHRVSGTWHPTHSIYGKLLVSRVPDREKKLILETVDVLISQLQYIHVIIIVLKLFNVGVTVGKLNWSHISSIISNYFSENFAN